MPFLVTAFGVILTAIVAFGVATHRRIRQLELEKVRMDTQLSPLWANVQSRIADELHHPNPRYAEMDTLLEQLEALTITVDGRTRLKKLLEERSKDMHQDITEGQRTSASLMILVMDKVVVESKENIIDIGNK